MTPEQLQAFCNPEIDRLATPWTVDDWTYASDGAICVRVPKCMPPDFAYSGRPRHNVKAFPAWLRDGEKPPAWEPIPLLHGMADDDQVKIGRNYYSVRQLLRLCCLPNVKCCDRAGVLLVYWDGGQALVARTEKVAPLPAVRRISGRQRKAVQQ